MVSDSDPVTLLKQITIRYRARVVGLKLYDPNVCTSGVHWRDAIKNRPLAPDWFRHQVSLRQAGWRVTLRSNDRFVAVGVRGAFGSRVPFSVNRPDRVMALESRRLFRFGTAPWAVFLGAADVVPALLDRPDIGRGIASWDLGKSESLHVYGNGLLVYIQPRSLQRVVEVVAAVAILADQLPPITAAPLDISDLPVGFHPLAPLVKIWGESDDAVRENRLARASRARLIDLVGKVAPHFRSINAYLDRFHDEVVPESAAAP